MPRYITYERARSDSPLKEEGEVGLAHPNASLCAGRKEPVTLHGQSLRSYIIRGGQSGLRDLVPPTSVLPTFI